MNTTIGTRTLRVAIGTGAVGVVALLAGLAWDARLHAADPDLAAVEGVFTMTNPGHVLAAAGIVLVTCGVVGAAWIVWLGNRSIAARIAGGMGLALVPVLAGGVAAASVAAEAGHAHEKLTRAHLHPADGQQMPASGPTPHSHDEDPAGEEQTMAEPPATRENQPEPAEDSDAAHQHTRHRDYDALWAAATPDERAEATKLVEDTRAATAEYADFDTALAAGYRPNPQGGDNATHHPNRSLVRDGRVLDPTAPESLMFWTARDGRKVLVGVVYKTTSSEDAPAPGGELTAWHTHAGDQKCYPAQDAGCPQNTAKMLHVFFFDGAQDPFTESMVAAAGGREAFARAMRGQAR
jgi:hypothetical protein